MPLTTGQQGKFTFALLMEYKDTITLNAFLTAATRLEHPLPIDLQHHLNEIAEQFPDSIYELHEIAEQYEPLNREYITALQDVPSVGGLKEVESQPAQTVSKEPPVSWEEVEQQLGTYFKDMVLDLIERSHPDYDRKMADALNAALTDLEQHSAISADEIDDWIANIFDNPDDEL